MSNTNEKQPPVERGRQDSNRGTGINATLQEVEPSLASDTIRNAKLVQQVFAFRYMAKFARAKKLGQLPRKLHGKTVDQD